MNYLPAGANSERYNHHTYELGLKNFEKVLPRMEKFLQEKIIVSNIFYDCLDGKTNLSETNIELKSRSIHYNRAPMVTWLVPASKIKKAAASPNKTIIFYYWARDDSLWYQEFDQKIYDELEIDYPSWHQFGSAHYYVPSCCFKRVP